MPKLYLITGIPGSGKTTLARKMYEEGKVGAYYEADMWMTEFHGKYLFDPKKLGYCHEKCQEFAGMAMENGIDLAVSNTTLTKKEARPYIEMALDCGYDIEIIHLQAEFGSIHNVPFQTIQYMKARRELFTLEDFS